MLAELQGLIERITYFNEETGFAIARVKVYGRHDLVTVVGTMREMNPGEIILSAFRPSRTLRRIGALVVRLRISGGHDFPIDTALGDAPKRYPLYGGHARQETRRIDRLKKSVCHRRKER